MKRGAETRVKIDARTRLLVMLAVLSLPLLIISLFQLHSYQRNLGEQARETARFESATAARMRPLTACNITSSGFRRQSIAGWPR